MKVLLISAAFPPMRCGGADYTLRLCAELAASGLTVSALGPLRCADMQPHNFELCAAIETWNWASLNRILDHVRRVKPQVVDIIFTGWVYGDHPMITFLPTFIKRIDRTIRVVTHIESLGGVKRSQSPFLTAACRAICSFVVGRAGLGYEYGSLLRDSDGVIFLGERDRQMLVMAELAILEKSMVIAPPPIMPVAPPFSGVERQQAREVFAIGSDCFLIAFYGYLYPGKGVEHLFDALKQLIDSGKNVKLLIVGDAPESYVLRRAGRPDYLVELKKMCTSLGLDDYVVWTSYAPFGSASPSEHLRLADCCVLPFKDGVNQHNSSFWFTAAHELPIVTTRGEATESLFEDGKNVILSSSADAMSIAACVSRLMDDPKLRNNLGAQIGNVARRQISWSKCIRDTIAVYKGEPVPLDFAPMTND